MPETRRCPQCGADIPPDAAEGVCPKCLMRLGLEGDETSPVDPNATAHVSPRFRAPEPEQLSKRFPQLEILELLGQGGMGAVYKARQPALDRLVAVKILPPEVAEDPGFTERFTREARALAKLNHPNIVSVYDFGQVDGQFYFVMEFVDGLNLRQMLKGSQLEPQEALAIVPQICDALQFAHDEGLVHRDIKPENILLDKKGHVKIADFGLAKLLGKTPADITLTGPGHVMGTPHYMSPEQMEHPLEVDHRADIYSLGVVFYEMLTGELPIGRFEPPSKKVRIDVRLDEVVLRTLESAPDRRYQHASDVKTEVESIVGASDTRFPPAKPDTADFESWVRGRLKAPAIGLLVAGIVNLLAAVSIVLIPVLVRLGHLGTVINAENMDFAESVFFVVVAIVSLVLGIILLIGAARMFDLQNWGIAGFAAVGAILPCAAGFPISLPCGIWALIVLSRRDVRTAFADWDADSEREQMPKGPDSAVGWAMPVGLALGLALGAATDNIGLYMTLGMVLGLLFGCVIDMNNRRKLKD